MSQRKHRKNTVGAEIHISTCRTLVKNTKPRTQIIILQVRLKVGNYVLECVIYNYIYDCIHWFYVTN